MKKLGVALLFLFLANTVFAIEKGYTLANCFVLALKQSNTLADQQERVIQAEEHYKQSLGALLPIINGSATYGRQDPTGAGANADQTALKISLTQPLFRGFRITGAIKQNESLLKAQKSARQWAAFQLYADVSQAFYLLLYLQQDKQFLEEQDVFYNKRLKELRDRVQIGRSRKTEVLSFEVSRAQLKAQILDIDTQIQSAESLLRFLTGLNSKVLITEIAIDDSLKSLNDYIKRIPLRPDILAAQNQLTAAKTNADLSATAEWAPTIDLSGNYYLQHPTPLTNIGWDAQITMTLPNFLGDLSRSKTKESFSIMRQLEISFNFLNQKTKEDINDLYFSLTQDKKQILALEKANEYANQNVNTVIQDYRNGLSNNLEVLQALNALIDVKRSLNKMYYAYKINFAKLNAMVANITLPEELSQ